MLLFWKARVRSVDGKVMTWAKAQLTDSFRPLLIITGLVGDALRSRQELLADNMRLRQQLSVERMQCASGAPSLPLRL